MAGLEIQGRNKKWRKVCDSAARKYPLCEKHFCQIFAKWHQMFSRGRQPAVGARPV
jgi:hypothetical protein